MLAAFSIHSEKKVNSKDPLEARKSLSLFIRDTEMCNSPPPQRRLQQYCKTNKHVLNDPKGPENIICTKMGDFLRRHMAHTFGSLCCSSNRFLKTITPKGGGYMEVLFFLHPPPSLPSPSPFSPPIILSPSLPFCLPSPYPFLQSPSPFLPPAPLHPGSERGSSSI